MGLTIPPAKQRLAAFRHLFSEPSAPAFHGLPATPVTSLSMSSCLSDEHLEYVNYKLRQYQKGENKKAQPKAATGPLHKLAHRVKTKISSIFDKNSQDDEPDCFTPSWASSLPSMGEFVAARRSAVEMDEEERRKMKMKVGLVNIRAAFSEPGNLGEGSSSQVQLRLEENLNGFQAFLRDGPKRARPILVDATSIKTSQNGVICLDAPSMPENKPNGTT